ncbi:hypothetical protein ACRALDRAFT_2040562 [Sodiomyces alcalophilus JCM 7366]|uniref:uncharacterized protein n=1 Tax=Sodiomyces alcalophilus JCM 7366 TaxID=591952 RepID=UPI0039B5142D
MAEELVRGPHSHRTDEPSTVQDGQAGKRPPHLGTPATAAAENHGQPRQAMAAPVTLPAMQDHYSQHQYQRGTQPPPDPRVDPRVDSRTGTYAASPNSANGYPPPPPSGGPPTQLPPLQGPGPRSPSYAAPDPRDSYYQNRQPATHYSEAYPPDYHRQAGPPPPPPARYPEYGQPAAPPGARYDYPPHAPPPRWEYAQNPVPMPQAAPRQRTSIACRYCRKRKIRCSGYQSAPGGKCVNCSRMNQECIFQPVSSSSSTAFIPVSAVPGGVPPGTPLYGAYGQPLHPGSLPPSGPPQAQMQPQPAQQPPQPPQPPAQTQPYSQGGNGFYQQISPSPTNAYPPYDAQRGVARRRPREPEEGGDELRLPPPDPTGDDPRRRSPAASSSNHSSPGAYASYPTSQAGLYEARGHARHSPGQTSLAPLSATSDDRHAPSAQRHSNSSTPAAPSTSSVMSLNNLVDNPSDIDKNMLGRLNRGPSSGTRR